MSVAVAEPPPADDRLARFRAIRAKLDPAGDPASAMDTFYLDSPHSVSARLAAELAISPASSHVLVGGVGSGKTTELLAVASRMADLVDTATLYVDISKGYDIARMVPGTIIAQVSLALANDLVRIEPSNPSIRRAIDVAYGSWEHAFGGDMPPGMEWREGILVPPEQVADNLVRIRSTLEELLGAIRLRVRHLVVMLDGLDRLSDLQAFDQLLVHDVKMLSSLGVGAVLVGPLRALYGLDPLLTQRFDSFHYQPWIDVTANPAGRGFLVGVLRRRAGEFLDEPGIDALVDASGGVLRDLLSLAQSALVEAYMDGGDRVGLHEVDVAVDAFGRKHMQGLRPAEIEVLQRARKHSTFVHASEDELALLMTRRVLEYRDRNQPRYTVHPTIHHLLQDLEKNDGGGITVEKLGPGEFAMR